MNANQRLDRMNANQRLDRLAGFLTGILAAALIASVVFWNSGCNSTSEGTQRRIQGHAVTMAHIAVAEGDLEAEDLVEIAKACRLAAAAIDGQGFPPAEAVLLVTKNADLDGYAAAVLGMIFTELDVYMLENAGAGSAQAAKFLNGIADALDPLESSS